jgi:hypothetical protein
MYGIDLILVFFFFISSETMYVLDADWLSLLHKNPNKESTSGFILLKIAPDLITVPVCLKLIAKRT